MTEREMYLGAIKVLQKRGWCKAEAQNAEGQHCMLGAMEAAGGRYSVMDAIYEVCDGSVADFNDDVCESVDDAIAALQIAADLAA